MSKKWRAAPFHSRPGVFLFMFFLCCSFRFLYGYSGFLLFCFLRFLAFPGTFCHRLPMMRMVLWLLMMVFRLVMKRMALINRLLMFQLIEIIQRSP